MALYLGNQKVCPVVKVGNTPTGTLSITENGMYDVTNYASANVSVSGGSNLIDYYWTTNFEVIGIGRGLLEPGDITGIIIAEGTNTGYLAVAYLVSLQDTFPFILENADNEQGEVEGYYYIDEDLGYFSATIDDLVGQNIITLPKLIHEEFFH